MTDDQLIALAEECGLGPILGGIRDADDMWLDCDVIGGLERFAALIEDRCIQKMYDNTNNMHDEQSMVMKEIIAEAIRSMKAY